MNYYSHNTFVKYITKWPHSFGLSGEREIYISEIQFPISSYLMIDRESQIFLLFICLDAPEYVDVSPYPAIKSCSIS